MRLSEWALQTITGLIAPVIIYLYWRFELRPIVSEWTATLKTGLETLERLQSTADTTYRHLGLFVDAYGTQMRELKDELRVMRTVYTREVDRRNGNGNH